MSWINDLLGKKEISKEAELTDATQEFQKKVKASEWLQGSMAIDLAQVEKEYNANLEAEAKALGKTAAYTSFETQDETLKKDLARDLHILSDYALAEILMDLRGTKEQNLPEMYVSLKEKAKADVKSSRAKCEQEVLDSMTVNAQLDWKAAFAKYSKEAKPEEPKEKDLFSPKLDKIDEKEWSTGKKDDKDFVISDKEKTTQAGAGNGREEKERTDVTKQPGEPQEKKAALKVDAFLVRDPDTELKVGSKITLARSIMSKEGTILEAGGDYEITATEGERYIITANGKSYTACRFDTPKFFRTAVLGKKADYEGWSNHPTWAVALWLDNDQGLYNQVKEEIATLGGDVGQLASFLKEFVESQEPEMEPSLWGDLLTSAMADVNWHEIAEHETEKHTEASKKENISKEAETVKDSPANKKDNITLPEGKETAGDKPSEAVDGTTLPPADKTVGDKADRAEEKNSLDKGEDVEDIEAVNKKAHTGTDHVAEMCPVCGSEGKDLANGQTDHYSCMGCGISYGHKQGSCGHCGSIASHASKEEVLKLIKTAEVQSPWIVVQKDGQDMIARREDVPTVSKESDEDKALELQK